MIKTFIEFVNESEEHDNFFKDLETSKIKLKLLPKFSNTLYDVEDKSTFSIGEPKRKFRPKVSTFKKKNNKGIF